MNSSKLKDVFIMEIASAFIYDTALFTIASGFTRYASAPQSSPANNISFALEINYTEVTINDFLTTKEMIIREGL